MKLKVCGMREFENITSLCKLKPNYIGFIFWAPSERYVTDKTPKINDSIKKTGVFVNASIDYIETMIVKHQLSAVQLHGDETPDYCKVIKNLNVEVIKTFSISNNYNFSILKSYEKNCDFFLFDTKGDLPGGNGINFDWDILKNYPLQKPFFLSGGIGTDNIDQIKKLLNSQLPIYAIDVNSKFEISPAKKNIDKLKLFKKELYEL